MTPSEGKRATIADVAREAGVGIATVDRVLNNRAPVRAETVRRVHEAAARVGFHALRVLAQRLETAASQRRLGFLLQRRSSEFYRNFAAELTRATRVADNGQHTPVVEYMEDLTPGSVADRMRRMGERCDVLALVAADHPKVNAAVEQLSAVGKPVYALLSDIGSHARAGYFGMDHRKAGRTAGWAMTRLVHGRGSICAIVGSHRYLGHELCEISFRDYLREHAPHLTFLAPLTSLEDRHFAYEATHDLLRRSSDLVGLYMPGGGIEGVVDALRENVHGRRVVVIAMDLFTETREALLDGTIDLVIDTPLSLIADNVVAAMLSRHETGEQRPARSADLPFVIYTPENIDGVSRPE